MPDEAQGEEVQGGDVATTVTENNAPPEAAAQAKTRAKAIDAINAKIDEIKAPAAEAKPAPAEKSKKADAPETPKEPPAEKADEPPTEDEPSAPQLSKKLQQAAERAGLDAEDVKALGDRAKTFLTKLAKDQDATSTKFAEMGRQMMPDAEDEDKADEEPEAPPAKDKAAPVLDLDKPFELDIDPEAFEDPDSVEGLKLVLDAPVKMLNTMREALSKMQKENAADRDYVRQMRAQQDQQIVDGFFGREDVQKDYGDIFGPADKATDAQKQARDELLTDAKSYYVARRQLGYEITPEQALDAMLSVSQSTRQKELARRELKEKVEKRAKQVSPPAARQRGGPAPLTREARVAAIDAKIEEIKRASG